MIPGPARWVKGSDVAAAALQVIPAAQIQPLAWELHIAVGVAIKKRKKKKRGTWKISQRREGSVTLEAEIGLVWPQRKAYQQPLHQNWKRW